MMIPWGTETKNIQSYKQFKANKFEKDRQKITHLFSDIKYTSLNENDQKLLIQELKKIANKF